MKIMIILIQTNNNNAIVVFLVWRILKWATDFWSIASIGFIGKTDTILCWNLLECLDHQHELFLLYHDSPNDFIWNNNYFVSVMWNFHFGCIAHCMVASTECTCSFDILTSGNWTDKIDSVGGWICGGHSR